MFDSLSAAFVLGVMGAGHCLGMCGGIAAALGFANQGAGRVRRLLVLLGYNLGRISSYALMGLIVAAVFGGVDKLTPLPVLRALSGLLLIGMGLYLAGWWKVLTKLEALGSRLWRHIAPFGQRLMPVETPFKAVLLGVVWGWLPCGLVYSVLALAASQPNPVEGALVMAAFGLGTLPAVVGGSLASEFIKRVAGNRWVSGLFGLAFIVYGLLTLQPVVVMLLASIGVIDQPMSHMHHH